MQDYDLKAKRADTGKFWGYGAIRKNKFDKYQASFRVTPELKALVLANEGGWLNFSMFEPFAKTEKTEPAKQQDVSEVLNDEIPF